MSGIYIHIPYCRKACHYCNFHFSTNLANVDELVDAICKDIELRNTFFSKKIVETIYFGGGTPSVLQEKHIVKIFNTISRYFTISDRVEITYECNPDDLGVEYLKILKGSGINRLSIGVQSFDEDDLIFMNRSHNALQSEMAIHQALDVGFENITIDLIYGSPTTTDAVWEKNIEKALTFNINHISSYGLTIEEKTTFHNWTKSGKLKPLDEVKSSQQFLFLIDRLTTNGFDHYEISNFSRPDHYAVHNTNYWKGKHYLGVGPSAHSYDGQKRSWTIANNIQYIQSLHKNIVPTEEEMLSLADNYNEYVMTGLRTIWGIDLDTIEQKFGLSFLQHIKNSLNDEWLKDKISTTGNVITLTHNGKLYADGIASNLFWIE